MKISVAPVAASLLALASPASVSFARAADIDLSTWTCKQFQSASKDDIGAILAWLDGYYKDEDDPPVIDATKFVDNAKKLAEYCAAHPDIGLITATDKLFQKE
jgi:acid stress chaperone HdeB